MHQFYFVICLAARRSFRQPWKLAARIIQPPLGYLRSLGLTKFQARFEKIERRRDQMQMFQLGFITPSGDHHAVEQFQIMGAAGLRKVVAATKKPGVVITQKQAEFRMEYAAAFTFYRHDEVALIDPTGRRPLGE